MKILILIFNIKHNRVIIEYYDSNLQKININIDM